MFKRGEDGFRFINELLKRNFLVGLYQSLFGLTFGVHGLRINLNGFNLKQREF